MKKVVLLLTVCFLAVCCTIEEEKEVQIQESQIQYVEDECECWTSHGEVYCCGGRECDC